MDRKYSPTELIARLRCGIRTTRPIRDTEGHEVGRSTTSITAPDGKSIAWSEQLHDVIEAYEAKVIEEERQRAARTREANAAAAVVPVDRLKREG